MTFKNLSLRDQLDWLYRKVKYLLSNQDAGGGSGTITSVNGDNGPTVQLDAVDIPFAPYSTITSTDTQTAIQELKDEVDLIPSSSINFLTEEITITDPTITGGSYTQQILAGQGVGNVILVHSMVASAQSMSVGTGNTTVGLLYSGDGGSFHDGTLFLGTGGDNVYTASGNSERRPLLGDNRAINIRLTNTTDQSYTGNIKVLITYSIITIV